MWKEHVSAVCPQVTAWALHRPVVRVASTALLFGEKS